MFSTIERQRIYRAALTQAKRLDDATIDRILRDVILGVKRPATVSDEDGICAHCLDPESQPIERERSGAHHLACDTCHHDWHPVSRLARRRM